MKLDDDIHEHDVDPAHAPTDTDIDLDVLRAVPQGFSIDSADAANWLVRKIANARQYALSVKAWAERELRRAEREEHVLMYLYGRQLETWVRNEINKKDGKRKSMPLPAGTVGFRTVGPRVVIDDEPAVLAWAKEHLPIAVTFVERLSKTAINEMAEATGEIPCAGVRFEPPTQRFFVR